MQWKSLLVAAAGILPALALGIPVDWVLALDAKSSGKGVESFHADTAIELREGSFLIKGYRDSADWLMRVDSRGKLMWATPRPLYVQGVYQGAIQGIRETDAGYVATTQSDGDSMAVLLYDGMGALASQLKFRSNTPLHVLATGAVLAFEAGPLTGDWNTGLMEGPMRISRYDFRKGRIWTAEVGNVTSSNEVLVQAMGPDEQLVFLPIRRQTKVDSIAVVPLGAAGPAGPTVRRAASSYPGMGTIVAMDWRQSCLLPDGRVALGGVASGVPQGSGGFDPDSIVVAAFEKTGEPAWRRTTAITRFESISRKGGFPKKISAFAVAASGNLRIILTEFDYTATQIELGPDGRFLGVLNRRPAGFLSPEPDRQGAWWSWGAEYDTLSTMPEPGQTKAVFYATPVLSMSDSGGGRRSEFFPEFGDTIFVTNNGDHPLLIKYAKSRLPGFRFRLPTSDGGFLIGGGLWKNGPEGIVAQVAWKVSPGAAVGIARMPARSAWPGRLSVPGSGFDALGRARATGKPPATGIHFRGLNPDMGGAK